MSVKFEQNRMVQTTRNFELFIQKRGFYNHLEKDDAIFKDISVAEIIV